MQRLRSARVPGVDGYGRTPHRRPRRDLDRTFDALVVAHQDRMYTIALRMLETPATRRRPPRTPWFGPTGRWPRTTPRESASCGFVAGSRRSCSTCAGHADSAFRARCAADLAGWRRSPGARAGRVPEGGAARSRGTSRRTRALGCPPGGATTRLSRRRRARHVDGLSYPEAAAALGRPEGTVKAQVHRGIALLRTMLEADARHELEEMTA